MMETVALSQSSEELISINPKSKIVLVPSKTTFRRRNYCSGPAVHAIDFSSCQSLEFGPQEESP